MGALRHRLNWTDDGTVHDGPRRYLLMRTDVLMGTLQRLPEAAQAAWLQAWAASTREHGAASLQAYLQMCAGNTAALVDATVQAAADLGWGCWAVTSSHEGLQLQVQGSPFVHGWQAAAAGARAEGPVCAPITGMFSALAALLLPGTVEVTESACDAQQQHSSGTCGTCHFTARGSRPG